MLLYLDPERADADLTARRLACPSCAAGRLAPWSHARPRVVALLDGRRVRLTPRRARCTDCRRTHVLLRGAATGHLHLLDPVAVPPESTGSDLGDALAALAAATQAATARLGPARAGQGWALLGRLGLIHTLASARGG